MGPQVTFYIRLSLQTKIITIKMSHLNVKIKFKKIKLETERYQKKSLIKKKQTNQILKINL